MVSWCCWQMNIKPCMGHISGTCEYWRKSMIIGENNTDRATKTSLFDRNWATSLKPRRRSRPLRLVWWTLLLFNITTLVNSITTLVNSITTLVNSIITLVNSTTTLVNSITTLVNSTTTLVNSTTTLVNSITTLVFWTLVTKQRWIWETSENRSKF
jgi:hypothetical protein